MTDQPVPLSQEVLDHLFSEHERSCPGYRMNEFVCPHGVVHAFACTVCDTLLFLHRDDGHRSEPWCCRREIEEYYEKRNK